MKFYRQNQFYFDIFPHTQQLTAKHNVSTGIGDYKVTIKSGFNRKKFKKKLYSKPNISDHLSVGSYGRYAVNNEM